MWGDLEWIGLLQNRMRPIPERIVLSAACVRGGAGVTRPDINFLGMTPSACIWDEFATGPTKPMCLKAAISGTRRLGPGDSTPDSLGGTRCEHLVGESQTSLQIPDSERLTQGSSGLTFSDAERPAGFGQDECSSRLPLRNFYAVDPVTWFCSRSANVLRRDFGGRLPDWPARCSTVSDIRIASTTMTQESAWSLGPISPTTLSTPRRSVSVPVFGMASTSTWDGKNEQAMTIFGRPLLSSG